MNLVFLNGVIIKKKDAKISPFDHGFLYGDGVYETLLVENNTLYFFADHWKRLSSSLSSIGIILPEYCDTAIKMQNILDDIIQKNSPNRARLRITISRGENNFDFLSSLAPTVLISLSSLSEYPSELYKNGISISTLVQQRPAPEIKSTNFMSSIIGRRTLAGTKNFEAVFITSQGYIREGTVSNIFGIAGKTVFVAPRSSVLPGTVQALVEQKVQENGYSIVERNFSTNDVFSEFDELFISNSLVGVLPVAAIDEKIFRTDFPLFNELFGEKFFEENL